MVQFYMFPKGNLPLFTLKYYYYFFLNLIIVVSNCGLFHTICCDLSFCFQNSQPFLFGARRSSLNRFQIKDGVRLYPAGIKYPETTGNVPRFTGEKFHVHPALSHEIKKIKITVEMGT